MKFTISTAVLSLSCVGLVHAQPQSPVITAAINAASHVFPGLPNYGLAQGSMFLLVGQGLATGTPPIAVANSPLPMTLAGASMQITVAGTRVDVPMAYSWAGSYQDDTGRYDQLAGIVPSATPAGAGTITVTFSNRTSAPAPITIVPAAFGIFTLNHTGVGPGIFTSPDLAFNSMADAAHLIGPFFPDARFGGNSLLAAAHPGDQLVIWGTGLGPITGDDAAPPPAGNLDVPVQVYVGNVQADVASQGRASCCSGIDQIQFTVPDGVEGCYVPVAVKIGAVVSNFATISISPDNTVCSDPGGWSVSDLQSSPNGAPANIAEINLTRLIANFSLAGVGSLQGTVDFENVKFRHYSGPLGILAAIEGAAAGLAGDIPSSGCAVFPFQSSGLLFDNLLPGPGDIPFGTGVPAQYLDAGPALNLAGPAGAVQIPKNPNPDAGNEYKMPGGTLGGGLPPLLPLTPQFLVPGSFTVDNGAGGADVKPFSAALTIPKDQPSWIGQDAISNIDRTQDLNITWSGSGLVAIIGNSANPAKGIGAQFLCIAGDADNGSFTVPSWVLSALPPSGLATDVPAPLAFLAVGTALSTPARFSAPGIDIGFFNWAAVQLKNVNFQ